MSREQDRWPRAKQVLDDVIAAEAGEQSSFLDRACDGEERSQLSPTAHAVGCTLAPLRGY